MGSTVIQTNISSGKLSIHELNPFETTMGNICAFVRKEKKVKSLFKKKIFMNYKNLWGLFHLNKTILTSAFNVIKIIPLNMLTY